MSNRPSLDDYIDVAERILAFKEAYPEGSLQTVEWEVKEIGNRTFIVYRAAAYREPGDFRPGMGIAWEPFPGPTPYTKDSELMNAETAAWGRAIVACGLPANRKIASKQEVQARQQAQPAKPKQLHEQTRKELQALYVKSGWTSVQLREYLKACGVPGVDELTPQQAKKLRELFEGAIEEKAA